MVIVLDDTIQQSSARPTFPLPALITTNNWDLFSASSSGPLHLGPSRCVQCLLIPGYLKDVQAKERPAAIYISMSFWYLLQTHCFHNATLTYTIPSNPAGYIAIIVTGRVRRSIFSRCRIHHEANPHLAFHTSCKELANFRCMCVPTAVYS